MALRYCPPCDQWVKGKECPACGADTMKAEDPCRCTLATVCKQCQLFHRAMVALMKSEKAS